MTTTVTAYLKEYTGLDITAPAADHDLAEIARLSSRPLTQHIEFGTMLPTPRQALYDAVVGLDATTGREFRSVAQGSYEPLGSVGLRKLRDLIYEIQHDNPIYLDLDDSFDKKDQSSGAKSTSRDQRFSQAPIYPPAEDVSSEVSSHESATGGLAYISAALPGPSAHPGPQPQPQFEPQQGALALKELAKAAIAYLGVLDTTAIGKAAKLKKNSPEIQNRHTLLKQKGGHLFEMTNSMTLMQRQRLIEQTSEHFTAAQNPVRHGLDRHGFPESAILLGKGGYATVRVARDATTDIYVAAKKIHAHLRVASEASRAHDTKKFDVVPASVPNFLSLTPSKLKQLQALSDAVISPFETFMAPSANSENQLKLYAKASELAKGLTARLDLQRKAAEMESKRVAGNTEELETPPATPLPAEVENEKASTCEIKSEPTKFDRNKTRPMTVNEFKKHGLEKLRKNPAVRALASEKQRTPEEVLTHAADLEYALANAFNGNVLPPATDASATYYCFSELGITTLDSVIDTLNLVRSYVEGRQYFHELTSAAQALITRVASFPETALQGSSENYYNESGFLLKNARYQQRFINTLAQKMISALQTLHQADFSHRDVKPSNMVFTKNKESNRLELKFIDMDTVAVKSGDHKAPKIGSRAFAPVEVLDKHTSQRALYDGEKADAFSLGISIRLASRNSFSEIQRITGLQIKKQAKENFKRDMAQNSVSIANKNMQGKEIQRDKRIQKNENYHVQSQIRVFATLAVAPAAVGIRDIADLMLDQDPGARMKPEEILNPDLKARRFFSRPDNFLLDGEFSSFARQIMGCKSVLEKGELDRVNREDDSVSDLQTLRRNALHSAKIDRAAIRPGTPLQIGAFSALTKRERVGVAFVKSAYNVREALTVDLAKSLKSAFSDDETRCRQALEKPMQSYKR